MITVREATEADLPGIAGVLIDTWRATYRGMVPDSYLDGMDHGQHIERGRRRLLEGGPGRSTWVAEVDGQVNGEFDGDAVGNIVAIASGGPERKGRADYPAELYAIYSLPAYQGRGIGRRLVRGVADRLAAAGFTSMIIWVLAANPARRFYESLGGRLVDEAEIEIGGVTLPEVAYAWDSWDDLKV